MSPGTYTLKFDQPNVAGVQDILSQVFVVATPTSDSDRLVPRATGGVSPDGTCGGAAGNICLGSGLGDCCSRESQLAFPLLCCATDIFQHTAGAAPHRSTAAPAARNHSAPVRRRRAPRLSRLPLTPSR
jgi:hypothetical protein